MRRGPLCSNPHARACQPSRKKPAECQPSRKDRANLRANYQWYRDATKRNLFLIEPSPNRSVFRPLERGNGPGLAVRLPRDFRLLLSGRLARISAFAHRGPGDNAEVIERCLARRGCGTAVSPREALCRDTTFTSSPGVVTRQFPRNSQVTGAIYTASVHVVWSALPENADEDGLELDSVGCGWHLSAGERALPSRVQRDRQRGSAALAPDRKRACSPAPRIRANRSPDRR